MPPQTLYEKLWNAHVVRDDPGGASLIYVDRHLVQEVSSPQAFDALRAAGRKVHDPSSVLAMADHAVPTDAPDGTSRTEGIADPLANAQLNALAANAQEFGLPYLPLDSGRQGIVHVVGPEMGFTLPGTTLVCGDSHTSTHGAFGALAFGIGSSECHTVLATQCIWQRKSPTMRIDCTGAMGPWIGAKDIALALIARIGADGATGHAIEFTGPVIEAMSMEQRMTLCNMAIEAGARIALIAPDETTFAYLDGREMAPTGAAWDAAVEYWRTLKSDDGAAFDRAVTLDVSQIVPMVSWGTSPEQSLPITGSIPDPAGIASAEDRLNAENAIAYMGLAPGMAMAEIAIDRVFIGSCTNARIEDLRAAASVVAGRKVAATVRAMVVPGSTAVRRQAEDEGLDIVFREAGFEWRQAGCSMCVAMNNDRLAPGERCASTSNRNFEGRQGRGGRTFLMGPAMAAAAAIAGHIADVRSTEARQSA